MILLFLINHNEIDDIPNVHQKIYENHSNISKSYIFIESYNTNEESIHIYEKYTSLFINKVKNLQNISHL